MGRLLFLVMLVACRPPLPRITADGARIDSFAIAEPAVTSGDSITLRAKFSGALGRILPDDVAIESDLPLALPATITAGSVFETRTYTLEVGAQRSQATVTLHAAPEPVAINTLFFVRNNDRAQAASVPQQPGMSIRWSVSGNGAISSSDTGSSIAFDVGDEFGDVELSVSVKNAVGRQITATKSVLVAGLRRLAGSLLLDQDVASAAPVALAEARFVELDHLAHGETTWAFQIGVTEHAYEIVGANVYRRFIKNGSPLCQDGDVNAVRLAIPKRARGNPSGDVYVLHAKEVRRISGGAITTIARIAGSVCSSGTVFDPALGSVQELLDLAIAENGDVYLLASGGDGRRVIRLSPNGSQVSNGQLLNKSPWNASIFIAVQGDPPTIYLDELSRQLGVLAFTSDMPTELTPTVGAGTPSDGPVATATFGTFLALLSEPEGVVVFESSGNDASLRLVRDGFVTTLAGPRTLLTLPTLVTDTALTNPVAAARTSPDRFTIAFFSGLLLAEIRLPPSAFAFGR